MTIFLRLPLSHVYKKHHEKTFLWQAVWSKIQSSEKIIQSRHNSIEFNLPNMLKESKKAFNRILRLSVLFIIMTKYLLNPVFDLFNPVTGVFIQSNHLNIYSIQSLKCLFKPCSIHSWSFTAIHSRTRSILQVFHLIFLGKNDQRKSILDIKTPYKPPEHTLFLATPPPPPPGGEA